MAYFSPPVTISHNSMLSLVTQRGQCGFSVFTLIWFACVNTWDTWKTGNEARGTIKVGSWCKNPRLTATVCTGDTWTTDCGHEPAVKDNMHHQPLCPWYRSWMSSHTPAPHTVTVTCCARVLWRARRTHTREKRTVDMNPANASTLL